MKEPALNRLYSPGVKVAYPGHGLFEEGCAHVPQRLLQVEHSIMLDYAFYSFSEFFF